MTSMRKKSTLAFSVCSFLMSLLFSLLFFSIELKIMLPLVVSATVFAGSLGFILGNNFSSSGSKYKAMLLGSAITAITFILSITVLTISLKVSSLGHGSLFRIDTYLSEIILNIGIGSIFAAPVLLPFGAYIGVYVKNV